MTEPRHEDAGPGVQHHDGVRIGGRDLFDEVVLSGAEGADVSGGSVGVRVVDEDDCGAGSGGRGCRCVHVMLLRRPGQPQCRGGGRLGGGGAIHGDLVLARCQRHSGALRNQTEILTVQRRSALVVVRVQGGDRLERGCGAVHGGGSGVEHAGERSCLVAGVDTTVRPGGATHQGARGALKHEGPRVRLTYPVQV